jgi:hypothetical protein
LPFQLLQAGDGDQLLDFLNNLDNFLNLYTEVHKFDLYKYWNAIYPSNWKEVASNNYSKSALSLSNNPQVPKEECANTIRTVAKFLEEIGDFNRALELYTVRTKEAIY